MVTYTVGLPLAVYLLVEAPSGVEQWLARLFGITSILALVFAMLRVRGEEKESKEQKDIAYNRWELQTQILAKILDELKDLREDFALTEKERQRGKNEPANSDNAK